MSYASAKARHDAAAATHSDASLQHLMCAAHGCPNRWTVDAGNGRLCGAHAWAEPEQWPDITYAQQWDETERARLRGEASAPPARRTANPARLRRLLASLQQRQVEPRDPKAWAHKLRAREESGETLTQRDMWRAALAVELAREAVEAA
ncbi:MAG TPA: hypothetical protein VJO99_09265 [Burkholderiaceae bacterium]|nr:hypothetical protein [Burkholderiaceae bacterium]